MLDFLYMFRFSRLAATFTLALFLSLAAHGEDACSTIATKLESLPVANREVILEEMRLACAKSGKACSEEELGELIRIHGDKEYLAMDPKYRGEDKVQKTANIIGKNEDALVTYYSDQELEAFRVRTITQKTDKGDITLLVDESGKPLTTSTYGSSRAIYIVNRKGELLIQPKPRLGYVHHSSLSRGEPVLAAGEVDILNGEIVSINNLSGHYRPAPAVMSKVVLPKLREKGLLNGEAWEKRRVQYEAFKAEFRLPTHEDLTLPARTAPVMPPKPSSLLGPSR